MEPIQKKSTVDLAVEKLTEYICSGSIAVGDKMPAEMVLCKQLNISRTTIREAYRVLQSQGYLDIQPGRGAFVASKQAVDINPVVWLVQNEKELRDAIEVRNALEPVAARKRAETASEAALRRLKKIHADFLAAVKAGDTVQIAELDELFHGWSVRESGNQLLNEIKVHLIQGMHTFRSKTFTVPENVRNAVEPHTRILNAITGRDGNAAEQEMRKHLKMVNEDLSSSINAYMHNE